MKMLCCLLAALFAAVSVEARWFTFLQKGYTDGAFVTFVFEAEDLNANGWIEPSEVSRFHMAFSGNSLVAPYSLASDEADTFALYYRLDGGPMSDDNTTQQFEGLYIGKGPVGYIVADTTSAICDAGMDCALVSDGNGTDWSQRAPRPVASVPLNTGAMLIAWTLLAIAGSRMFLRRRQIRCRARASAKQPGF